MIEQVTQFINENMLHSKVFDRATETQRRKAVNQAVNTLIRHLPDVYKDKEALPVEDVAEQTLWLLKVDDTFQRADLGAVMVTVDGVTVQMREMDRTIAPSILNLYGIRDTRKRKVGAYTDVLGFRSGMGRHPYRRY